MADTIRLNKVLRKLNVSLDRAVEFLNSKGIEIDARPTTKITEEVHDILSDEFHTDASKRVKSLELSEVKLKEKKALRLKREKELEEKLSKDEPQKSVLKAKTKLFGPKQVGKIELEKPKVKTPKPKRTKLKEEHELEIFKKWLIDKEQKSYSTSNSYGSAIENISDHLSNELKKKINLYEFRSKGFLESVINVYDSNGDYSEIGNKGNRTYINALKALLRFKENKPKLKTSLVKKKDPIRIARATSENNNFDPILLKEAELMSGHYKLFYCLERTIRRLVTEIMEDNYGTDWWDEKVYLRIKENVEKKISYENNRIFSKKSENHIDYTTFSELRQIVKSNSRVFETKIKNIKDFNKIAEDLNSVRNSIAHSIPLPEDEVIRLELAVNDWFRLVN